MEQSKDRYLLDYCDTAIQLKNGFTLRVQNFIKPDRAGQDKYADFKDGNMVYKLDLDTNQRQWVCTKSHRRKTNEEEVGRAIARRKKGCSKNRRAQAKRQRRSSGPVEGGDHASWVEAGGPSGVQQQQQQQQQQEEQYAQQEDPAPPPQRAENARGAVRLDLDAWSQELDRDPPAALRTCARVLGQLNASAEWAAALNLSGGESLELESLEHAQQLLAELAYKAEQLQQLKAPDMVIIGGGQGVGKSTLGNQLALHGLPKDLVREDEPDDGLVQGPFFKDTQVTSPTDQLRFVYTEERPFPDLENPADPKKAKKENDEEGLLPTGDQWGGVTGATIAVNRFVPDGLKAGCLHDMPCHFGIECIIHSAEDVNHALKEQEDSGEEDGNGNESSEGPHARVRAMFGLEEKDNLPRRHELWRLPAEFKSQKIEFRVNARHPDGIKMARRILKQLPCGPFWGMIKVARVFVPCTEPQPSFMDAPGLSLQEPYRMAKVHEALRMYPSFALVVVVKSREGTDSWAHSMAELGLPGCLGAHGSVLGPMPVKAFVLGNICDIPPKKKKPDLLDFLEEKYGPDSKFAKIFNTFLAARIEDKHLSDAMMKQAEAEAVFCSEENLETFSEADKQYARERGLLACSWWQRKITDQAWREAHKLYPMTLLFRDIKPDLPLLFEALEQCVYLDEGSKFNENIEKEDLEKMAKGLTAVIKSLEVGVKQSLSPSVRTRDGKQRTVAQRLRDKIDEVKEELLRDCTQEEYKKRVAAAEVGENASIWSPLVKKGRQNRLLKPAMTTARSETDLPYKLQELAVGEHTLERAALRIGGEAHQLINKVMDDIGVRFISLLKQECADVRKAMEASAKKQEQKEEQLPIMKQGIATFEHLAEKHLREVLYACRKDLSNKVEYMHPGNKESELDFLRMYDAAMHEDLKSFAKLRDIPTRLKLIREQCRLWGERLLGQLLAVYVPTHEGDLRGDSEWDIMQDRLTARFDQAFEQLKEGLLSMSNGGALDRGMHPPWPVSSVARVARSHVGRLMVGLDDARKRPGSYATHLHSLTLRTGGEADAPQGVVNSATAAGPARAACSSSRGVLVDVPAAESLLELAAGGASTSRNAGGASTSRGAGGPSTSREAEGAASRMSKTGGHVSSLARARELLQQEEVKAANARDALQHHNHSMEAQQQASQAQFRCVCCQLDEPGRSMVKAERLNFSVPLMRQTGKNPMCTSCFEIIQSLSDRPNADVQDKAWVQDAWDSACGVRKSQKRVSLRLMACKKRSHGQ